MKDVERTLDLVRGLLVDVRLKLEKEKRKWAYEIEQIENAFYTVEEVLEEVRKHDTISLSGKGGEDIRGITTNSGLSE